MQKHKFSVLREEEIMADSVRWQHFIDSIQNQAKWPDYIFLALPSQSRLNETSSSDSMITLCATRHSGKCRTMLKPRRFSSPQNEFRSRVHFIIHVRLEITTIQSPAELVLDSHTVERSKRLHLGPSVRMALLWSATRLHALLIRPYLHLPVGSGVNHVQSRATANLHSL